MILSRRICSKPRNIERLASGFRPTDTSEFLTPLYARLPEIKSGHRQYGKT